MRKFFKLIFSMISPIACARIIGVKVGRGCKFIRFGKIEIGDNTFIGTRSTILPNVAIGKNCIVGACSLVTKNIPDGQVWGGVPAHFICETSAFAEKCLRETPQYNSSLINSRIYKRKVVEKVVRKRNGSEKNSL